MKIQANTHDIKIQWPILKTNQILWDPSKMQYNRRARFESNATFAAACRYSAIVADTPWFLQTSIAEILQHLPNGCGMLQDLQGICFGCLVDTLESVVILLNVYFLQGFLSRHFPSCQNCVCFQNLPNIADVDMYTNCWKLNIYEPMRNCLFGIFPQFPRFWINARYGIPSCQSAVNFQSLRTYCGFVFCKQNNVAFSIDTRLHNHALSFSIKAYQTVLNI